MRTRIVIISIAAVLIPFNLAWTSASGQTSKRHNHAYVRTHVRTYLTVVVEPATTTTVPPVTTTPTSTSAPLTPITESAPAVAAAPVDIHATFECIIAHESGGDPHALNPSSGAGGLFQFLPSSWLAYGGNQYAATADQATSNQQWTVALAAQAESYWYPWVGTGCTPVG